MGLYSIITIRKAKDGEKQNIVNKIKYISSNKINELGQNDFHFLPKIVITTKNRTDIAETNKIAYSKICGGSGNEYSNVKNPRAYAR